jgi:hypothetical protein
VLATEAIAEEQKIEVDLVGLDDEVSHPVTGSIAVAAAV